MTPKEKAKELYYKFTCFAPLHSDNKECALIAVDEIIDSLQIKNYSQADQYEYWNEVKQEIQKL